MKYFTSDKQEKIIAAFLTIFLIIIIIPLVVIAKYNFPSIDDYCYALDCGYLYGESIGGVSVFWTQIKTTYDYWINWQGTFFANYFAYVCNVLFMEKFYYITPMLTLLPMVLAEIYAGIVILEKGFGATKAQALIGTIPCILLQVFLTQCPVEAYYWMCGATLYTTMYAVAIVGIANMILLLLKKPQEKRGFLRFSLFVLAFMIGGSNYISGLFTLGIFVCITIYAWYTKHREKVWMSSITLFAIVCMLLSIFSPGAAKRQMSVGENTAALEAIINSFVESYRYISMWTIVPVIILVLALIPLFWKIVGIKQYRYPLPVIFTILSFCIYSMEFTPCLYALGIIGAYRIQNIYRFTLYILLMVNVFYWTGYVRRCLGERLKTPKLMKKIPLKGLLYAGFVFVIVSLNVLYYGGSTVTTVSALYSLRTGNAARYYAQYEERMKILTDSDITDAVLEPYTEVPYLLYFGDIKEDPTQWENTSMAKYFHKNSIRIGNKDVVSEGNSFSK